MALGDIEGAQIHLKRLSIAHHMASWESIQEILIRHYSRQLFHEIYKVSFFFAVIPVVQKLKKAGHMNYCDHIGGSNTETKCPTNYKINRQGDCIKY